MSSFIAKAVSQLHADLVASRMTPYDVGVVEAAYASALRRRTDDAWRGFYESVISALLRLVGSSRRRDPATLRATESLLRLVDDDLGAQLVEPALAVRLHGLIAEPAAAQPVRTRFAARVQVRGAVALVTDASEPFGALFVEALAAEGAGKIYVPEHDSAILPDSCGDLVCAGIIVPLELDLDDPSSLRAAAGIASDLTLLVNTDPASKGEVVDRCRAFRPVLSANAPSAIISFVDAEALRAKDVVDGVHFVSIAAPSRDVEAGEIVAGAFDAVEELRDREAIATRSAVSFSFALNTRA